MSTIYLKDLQETEEQIEYLKCEYSILWERYYGCWTIVLRNQEIMKQIQDEIDKIYIEIKVIELSQNSWSQENIKILKEADLNTLKKYYEKCYEKKVPKGDLINAIEEEIHQRYFKENNIKADHIYKLKKFMVKKKY